METFLLALVMVSYLNAKDDLHFTIVTNITSSKDQHVRIHILLLYTKDDVVKARVFARVEPSTSSSASSIDLASDPARSRVKEGDQKAVYVLISDEELIIGKDTLHQVLPLIHTQLMYENAAADGSGLEDENIQHGKVMVVVGFVNTP